LRFEPPKGFDDLLPEEYAVKQRIIDVIREVYRLYGYEEVETPTLEYYELFEAKSGEEIRHRMFVFTDPHGRRLVLRPEVTASIARMVASELSKRPMPLRLGYIADCYRYDEPQWGRRRRFWQGGFELFGSSDPSSDVEIILASRDVFNKLNIKDFIFKIGHVGVMRGLLGNVDQKTQDLFLSLIDRKRVDEAFRLIENSLTEKEVESLKKLIAMKGGIETVRQATDILASWEKSAKNLENLLSIIELLSEADPEIRYVVDLGFARGLEYYTGFIFEQLISGEELSFNGGGRYDGLVELFGGSRTPAVGCSIGISRLLTYLTEKQGMSVMKHVTTALVVVGDKALGYGIKAADYLRRNGVPVFVDVSRKRLSDFLEFAATRGFSYVVIVGEREMESGKITVRNLIDRKQESMELAEAVVRLRGV